MPARRYYVILNARAGTANAMGITPDILREHFGADGSIVIDDEMDATLAERIQWACDSDADVIVAAGGDGTVTAIASAIVGTGKTLAILPLGTMNLLARDLGVPLDLPNWLAAMDQMQPQRIDVGEVNGRIFLHKVVIGVVPSIAAGREQIRGRPGLGAKLGFLNYFYRRLVRAKRIAVEIRYRDGTTRVRRAAALAVANNGYDESLGRIFAREHLDGENLTLYVLKHLSPLDVLRLSAKMVIGTWQHDEAIEVENVRSLTIRTRKPCLKVMFDGELEMLDTPLNFRILPAALSVLAPVPAAVAEANADLVAGT